LPGGIGQHLGEGFFEPRMIVGDDELDAAKTPVSFKRTRVAGSSWKCNCE
jgi:hypothetical protein